MARVMRRSRAEILELLAPTDDQLARARQLHGRSVVCDSYGMATSCHCVGLPYPRDLEEWAAEQLEGVSDGQERREVIRRLRKETLPRRATLFADDPA
jgi:hypothetical protein